MSDDAADRTAADDPTQIVAPPDSAQLPLLTRRLLDAAVERGLITPSQAELLTGALESEGANPERAISVMVERGLIKRAAGETLWSELQDGVIPGYRLTTELGRGAMGVVYRARQLRLDRDVALKVINPALATDPASLDRFEKEALALAKLNHPNIVQVYDYGAGADAIFLALELVRGDDLASLVQTEGALPEARALALIRDAALGLRHAHQAGIVHRDVKPHNMLLVDDGGDSRARTTVKITDFGLARGPQTGSGTATAAGTILGTPAYMAPEQADGREVDFRCDIYALGATLHHFLTGRTPFGASSVLQILIKKQSDPLPDPREVAPDLSPDTLRLLDGMLARDPAARYGSYDELLDDLEAALGDGHVSRPLVDPAVCGVALADRATLGAGAATGGQGSAGARPPAAKGGSPAASRAPLWVAAGAVLVVAALAAATHSGAPAPSGAATNEVTTTPGDAPARPGPPPPEPPTAAQPSAAERAVATLEGLEPEAVVRQTELLDQLRADVAQAPVAERIALESRLGAVLLRALRATEQETLARLEADYRAGRYDRLAAGVERARDLYARADEAPPPALEALAQHAAAAAGAAGAEERAAWERIQAAPGPAELLELGAGFAERFPFSPVADQVAARVAEAEAQLPRVRLLPVPASARVEVAGRAGEGPWEGRLPLGQHPVRAEAEGYFPLELTVEVAGPLERELVLGPRPRAALAPNPTRGAPLWNPRRFAREWSQRGSWRLAPAVAGVTGEAGGGHPARLERDLAKPLRLLKGAPGWTLDWELARPGPADAAGEAQLAQGEVALIVRFGPDGLELLQATGDAAPRALASRALTTPPERVRIDWDGQVAVVAVDGERLGSAAPGWGDAAPALTLSVTAGELQFRDFHLMALRPVE